MKVNAAKLPVYIMLVIVSALLLFPFYWLLSSSLKSRQCITMIPPAFYPSKVHTVDVTLDAKDRIVTAQGKTWYLLCQSKNLLDPAAGTGGYYAMMEQTGPSARTAWLADIDIEKAATDTQTVIFTGMPVHKLGASNEQVVLIGKLVRQKEAGFDEIVFTLPQGSIDAGNIKVHLNVGHEEIRDFDPQWANYPQTFKGPEATFGQVSTGFGVFMRNSFFISTLAVIGQVFSSSLVAFGFARLRFKGREFLFILLLATMMIPGQVTLFPLFAFYKQLGWIDSFLPLIVPHFTAGAFNVFLMRQYMLTIPRELEESAEIDGCGPLRRYFHIILPNCIPVLVVVALFTFVYTWQDVLGPLIYLDNPAYRTVPLGLEYFRSPYVDNRHLLMTGAVLAMLPVAILFIFLQRYIMSGIVTTGLKS
ncbi:MAG: carbohydrate ABC transporter permease [Planctomycetaceae bacterium]|nr:carbohydrate ABC transporter permease [Planctomycetaceae bacterium]